MSNWSFRAFKEKVKDWIVGDEIDKLKKEKERVEQELKEKILEEQQKTDAARQLLFKTNEKIKKSDKPYLKATLSGSTITLVTLQADVLYKENSSQEDLEKLKGFKTEDEVFSFMVNHDLKSKTFHDAYQEEDDKEDIESIKKTISKFDILTNTGDFEVRDNSVYLKGIIRSIPKLLVDKFIELQELYNMLIDKENATEEEIDALVTIDSQIIGHKRFWMWSCLNPYEKVADWLYDFLKKGDFKITKDGMFLAYRRVRKVNEETDTTFVDAISNFYVKIKTVWKKKPEKFEVYLDIAEDELFIKEVSKNVPKSRGDVELKGNLDELYKTLSDIEENRYTDNYTKKMDIRIGQIVSIPRDKCNHSTSDCGTGGLHFANKHYDYYSFGDTGILMLVNPYNVVGIGSEKGRCCEYLPLCTIPEDEERQVLGERDFDTSELEEYYSAQQLQDLTERVKTDYTAEKNIRYSFVIPENLEETVNTIVTSLESLKSSISERLKKVS